MFDLIQAKVQQNEAFAQCLLDNNCFAYSSYDLFWGTGSPHILLLCRGQEKTNYKIGEMLRNIQQKKVQQNEAFAQCLLDNNCFAYSSYDLFWGTGSPHILLLCRGQEKTNYKIGEMLRNIQQKKVQQNEAFAQCLLDNNCFAYSSYDLFWGTGSPHILLLCRGQEKTNYKIGEMLRNIQQKKVQQNEAFAQCLLDNNCFAYSSYDLFWGTGLNYRQSSHTTPLSWSGKNELQNRRDA